jgi:PST family polysaccharide transporter
MVFPPNKNASVLASNFIALLILRGFQFIIPLITMPYIISVVGFENFGLISVSLSVSLFFGALVQYGFAITATRKIARHQNDHQMIEKIFSQTILTKYFLALVSIFLFLPLVFTIEKFSSQALLYIFSFCFVAAKSLFPIWFFQGIEKMKYITILSLASNVLFLSFLYVFVREKPDFIIVPLLNAISSTIMFVTALCLVRYKFKVRLTLNCYSDIKNTLVEGRQAFITQLAPTLYNNSTVLLLGVFTNNMTVGLYSAATKIIDAAVSLAYVLSSTFLPFISKNITRHKLFKKIMLCSGVVLTLITFVFSENITRLFFGINSEITSYISWLSICIFLLFFSMAFGTNFLMLIDKDRLVQNITIFTSFLFFLVALIVIPLFGIWGAIFVVIGARFVISLSQYAYYLKYKGSVGL